MAWCGLNGRGHHVLLEGAMDRARDCDGIACEKIGPRLQPEIGGGWEPKALRGTLFAFEGVNNSKGLAFVLGDEIHPWFEALKLGTRFADKPIHPGNDITSTIAYAAWIVGRSTLVTYRWKRSQCGGRSLIASSSRS